MKSKILFYGACFLLFWSGAVFVHAQSERRSMGPFEHLAVSIEAGTTGIGAQVAVPLIPNLALRGGFTVFPLSVSYTYEGEYTYEEENLGRSFSVPMDAKIEMFNGNLMLDIFPVRDSRFHFTAGLVFGSDRIITVTGQSPYDEPIQIGDVWIYPDQLGSVTAWIQTRNVKPYLGIGFGRTIPRSRFGYKFELGGLFQGSPKITTDNAIANGGLDHPDVNKLNKYLDDYFQVYPVLKFNLTYRIF